MAWLLLLLPLLAAADPGDDDDQAPEPDSEEDILEVTVFGNAPRAVENVPGAATVLTAEDLEAQRPLSANEALQTAPGVFVQDEDGMGLRQNVGIRGLDPNRSRKVLVLEDGMPVALGPYGEPEMYYSPAIAQMERVEIVKGSGSILFGPQTVGGVINYVTPPPPEDLSIDAEVRAGSDGYLTGQVGVGDSFGPVGVRVSGLHQRFAGSRGLGLVRTDVSGQARVRFTPTHSLLWKVGVTDEASAATYLGLTTPQYETDPTFNFAVHDAFTLRRFATGLTHGVVLGSAASLRTLAYAHYVERDWWRQDFDRDGLGDDYERVIDGKGHDVTGAASWPTDGSAIFFADSTGLRGRAFTVAGIEPRLLVEARTGCARHTLQTGIRLHWEHTHEVRVDVQGAASRDGVVRTEDDRWGRAVAGYALHTVGLARDAVQLSPGVRVEALQTRQVITRKESADLAVPIEHTDVHTAVLPGLGVAWQPDPDVTLFTGVHRGWAPPRTKDAVTTGGETIDLESEHSWNAELGGRVSRGEWLHAEVAGFVLRFDNQVIPPTESGGAVSEGVVNGGRTLHRGVEAAVSFDPAAAYGAELRLPVRVAYTFVRATFEDGWSPAIVGQSLPYAPAHQLWGSIGVRHPVGFSAQVEATAISARYTDKVQTADASVDGLVGRLDPYLVVNAQLGWEHAASGLRVFVAGKNLLDEQYIASRAPRGIQPGSPRQVFGGVGWRY